MMRQRTALYVYEPSTVAIRANECDEPELMLCRYGRQFQRVAPGALALDPGVYMVMSSGRLDITGDHITIIALTGKEVPPEPRAQVVGLEQGATAAEIQQFFAVSKGIDVEEPPVEPVPSTAEATDDPDGI
jgi:hypothetical protein